jgi:hypothetical protein
VSQMYPQPSCSPFHRLLRLTGLRWRYSSPPPHEVLQISLVLKQDVKSPSKYVKFIFISLLNSV